MTSADEPLVRVRDLARYFVPALPPLLRLGKRRRRVVKAVDRVDFDIKRARTFSLVGESGCGKSTLARMLVGLLRPTAGRIEFDGIDIYSASAQRSRLLRRRWQIVFQAASASLDPHWRVRAIVAEPIKTFGLVNTARERRERVDALLRAVGLDPGDAERYPHEFSSGQRQRISIARALAGNPEFIVCDEPTSALDVSVQAQILNLLKELQASLGLTYLFISHDLAVVSYVADEIAVMYLGRLCEVATTYNLLNSPRHPYTRLLLDTTPDMGARRSTPPAMSTEALDPLGKPLRAAADCCLFHSRCPLAFDRCRRERPALRDAGSAWVACHAVHRD